MLMRIVVSTAVVLIAACSQAPQGVNPPAVTTAPVAAPPVDPAPGTKAGVRFSASPASIRRCDAKDGNASVSLAWDVSAASVQFVTINIGDKVFAQGAASGAAATGEWVRDDTVFTLTDAASKQALATLRIPFVDC